MSSTTKTISGITFQISRLSVDDACDGLQLIAEILGPGLLDVDTAQAEASLVKALAGGLMRAGKFKYLLRLFAPVTKVSRTSDGKFESSGGFVDLAPFADDVFEGKLDLLMAYLVQACVAEFGGFLDGGALADLLRGMTEA